MALDRTSKLATTAPPGLIMAFTGQAVPIEWLFCNGGAVSRSTYATLFNTIVPSKGSVTFDSSTDKGTLSGHGLNTDDAVFIAGGTAPGGTSNNTIYYINSPTANDFKLASTRGGAAINLTSNGSGCTLYFCPYGLGDGSTTFNVPDLRGKVPVGLDNIGGSDAGVLAASNAHGLVGGEQNHTLTTAEMAAHTHGVTDPAHYHNVMTGNAAYSNAIINGGAYTDNFGGSAYPNSVGVTIQNAGSGNGHNNMQPYLLNNYIIKT